MKGEKKNDDDAGSGTGTGAGGDRRRRRANRDEAEINQEIGGELRWEVGRPAALLLCIGASACQSRIRYVILLRPFFVTEL
uniref:Uncharacterized protein n=1 Tax=Oryza brachyantha TaxID=4533 RepID=J3M4Z6_ORYBR